MELFSLPVAWDADTEFIVIIRCISNSKDQDSASLSRGKGYKSCTSKSYGKWQGLEEMPGAKFSAHRKLKNGKDRN